jgi:hypothetical protein
VIAKYWWVALSLLFLLIACVLYIRFRKSLLPLMESHRPSVQPWFLVLATVGMFVWLFFVTFKDWSN